MFIKPTIIISTTWLFEFVVCSAVCMMRPPTVVVCILVTAFIGNLSTPRPSAQPSLRRIEWLFGCSFSPSVFLLVCNSRHENDHAVIHYHDYVTNSTGKHWHEQIPIIYTERIWLSEDIDEYHLAFCSVLPMSLLFLGLSLPHCNRSVSGPLSIYEEYAFSGNYQIFHSTH